MSVFCVIAHRLCRLKHINHSVTLLLFEAVFGECASFNIKPLAKGQSLNLQTCSLMSAVQTHLDTHPACTHTGTKVSF